MVALFLSQGIDPGAADIARSIVQGAEGRSDAIYLASAIIALFGVAFVVVLIAACYWLPRHIAKLIENYRQEQADIGQRFSDEMKREREFHQSRCEATERSNTENCTRIATAVNGLAEAIGSKRRRKTPGESTQIFGGGDPTAAQGATT